MVESVHKFINKLAMSYVNSVLNSIFFTAENAVCFAASFKNIRFYMFFYNKFNLFQQGIQMLWSREEILLFLIVYILLNTKMPEDSNARQQSSIKSSTKMNTNLSI